MFSYTTIEGCMLFPHTKISTYCAYAWAHSRGFYYGIEFTCLPYVLSSPSLCQSGSDSLCQHLALAE